MKPISGSVVHLTLLLPPLDLAIFPVKYDYEYQFSKPYRFTAILYQQNQRKASFKPSFNDFYTTNLRKVFLLSVNSPQFP